MRRLLALAFAAGIAAGCSSGEQISPAGPTIPGMNFSPGFAAPSQLASHAGNHTGGYPALAAQHCSQERSLRSLSSTAASRVEFVNLSSATIVVHWLSYTGERVRYNALPPGWWVDQATYVTHPWVVTDVSGTCLGVYSPAATPTTATIRDVVPPLTAASVASSLGAEINRSFIAAMTDTTAAQIGRRIVANCSRGGQIRIQHLGPAPGGGRVTLANTPVHVQGCAHSLNGRTVTAHGVLTGNGSWSASEPTSPVHLAGEIGVDELGPITIDGTTGAAFVGQVGGISVGTPDTPPPPNPVPEPCRVNGIPVECPNPAPGTNVTGTWVIPGQPGGLRLSHTTGTTGISGSGIIPTLPLPPGTTFSQGANSITGSIVGSTVSLVHQQTGVLRTVADTAIIVVTTTSTTRYSLQLSGSTMSGTASATITTVSSCSGSQFCPPGSSNTTTSNQSLTLTRQ